MQAELRPYEPSYYLLEESRESWEHIVTDKVVYAFDPCEVTGNISRQIAERYIEGDLWIELHLRFEGAGNRYAVILEAADGSDGRRSLREMELGAIPIYGDPPVLIDVAHQIELPEKVTLDGGGIRSVMRLKRIDDVNGVCGHPAGVLLEPLLGFGIPATQDRELRSLGIAPIQLSQRPHQLIERRTQAVEEVSQDEGNPIGRVGDVNVKAIESVCRIVFTPKGIRFRCEESADLRPQAVKVFLRPGCFQIGVS